MNNRDGGQTASVTFSSQSGKRGNTNTRIGTAIATTAPTAEKHKTNFEKLAAFIAA
jgi:hypothetical protein